MPDWGGGNGGHENYPKKNRHDCGIFLGILALFWGGGEIGRGEKTPTPQDKSQHLDFTTDPRPLYYKTPPCVFYHKNVRSKAVFGP